MKRSELKVGDRLYYAKPCEWTHHLTGDQVEVISLDPVRISATSYRIVPGNGAGVHVRIIDLDGTPGPEVVALVQHLRGPYAEILAEVKEQQAADRTRWQREHDRAKRLVERAAAVVARAVAEGASSARRNYSRAGSVEISADDLTALLDRLAAAERRADHGAA